MSGSEEAPVPPGAAVDAGAESVRVAPRGEKARVWAFAAVAGLIAGLGAFAIGESDKEQFGMVAPQVRAMRSTGGAPANPGGAGMPSEPVMLDRIEVRRYITHTTALTYGALGGLTGLALGLAAGLARRSFVKALAAGLVGL